MGLCKAPLLPAYGVLKANEARGLRRRSLLASSEKTKPLGFVWDTKPGYGLRLKRSRLRASSQTKPESGPRMKNKIK